MVKTDKVIRNNIRRVRIKKNMRQADVAKAIGVSTQAVQNWETGRRKVSYAILDKLCELYQVRTTEFCLDTNAIIPDEIMEALLTHQLQLTDYDIITDFIFHLKKVIVLG